MTAVTSSLSMGPESRRERGREGVRRRGKSLFGQNNEGRKTIQVRSMQDFPLESFCSVQSYTAWAGNGPSQLRMPRTLGEVRSPYRADRSKWNTTNTSRSLQLRLTGQSYQKTPQHTPRLLQSNNKSYRDKDSWDNIGRWTFPNTRTLNRKCHRQHPSKCVQMPMFCVK